jgi:hypothetical protein
MINVQISINNSITVASVSAVRVYPKSKNPRKKTICKYKIHIHGIYVGMLEHPYNCGVGLAIEMLKFYENISKKDIAMYKTMSIYQLTN